MSGGALLTLLTAISATQSPSLGRARAAYPAVAVLDAARQACDKLPSLAEARAHVARRGWTRVDDVSGTPIGPLVAYGMKGARALIGSAAVEEDAGAYRKTVAGEELWLYFSGVVTDGAVVRGCRVYDIDETRRITAAQAARWLRRTPQISVDRPELLRAKWTPGANPGQDSFELFFIPAGGEIARGLFVSGIGMTLDWVGKAPTAAPQK